MVNGNMLLLIFQHFDRVDKFQSRICEEAFKCLKIYSKQNNINTMLKILSFNLSPKNLLPKIIFQLLP